MIPDGVLNMLDRAIANQGDIKTHRRPEPISVFGESQARCRQQTALLTGYNGVSSLCQGTAGLHFNENQGIRVCNDKINLPRFCPQPLGKNIKATGRPNGRDISFRLTASNFGAAALGYCLTVHTAFVGSNS